MARMISQMNKLISSSQIQSINARYSDRLLTHGNSPLSLGWLDKSQQYLRFSRFLDTMMRYSEPYSILDIGCGFGDFASFLETSKTPPKLYTGIDINNDLLDVARAREYSFESHFYCANILAADDTLLTVDILKSTFVMAAGLFNYDFHGSSEKMHQFAFAMIEKMLLLCTECVLIDFIPEIRIDSYDPEPYIALYSLPKILSYLTGKGLLFSIDFSQKPNPMQEALLILNAPQSF
jgi:SAM-dependent methyltransferase